MKFLNNWSSKEFKISSDLVHMDILKESFFTYPKNLPDYYKNIPKFIELKDSFKKGRTMKHCSGFTNYFRNMISFRSPCDIQIIRKQNKLEAYFGSRSLNDSKRFNLHSPDQFLKHVNQDKYLGIAKIDLDIKFLCNAPMIVSNPWWYLNKFEILPGIINASKSLHYLNLFLPIEKNFDNLIIKKGQALCDIHFETEKKIKIKFVKELDALDLCDYYFSVFKKMILPKRIFNE